jgi:transcriptional regulator GlxA family with amidase domain
MRHEPKTSAVVVPARLRIGILLARRFTLAAMANFVDVLRLSADEGDRSRPIRCSWRVVAPRPGPVESSCGLFVEAEEALGDPERFDYIAVVGGLIGERQWLAPEAEDWLRRAAGAGVPLIGLCTGTFILARAGLMQGYRCCVSWFHRDDFLEEFEAMQPISDQIFIVDRDRLTCSGGASTAHLAAYLVDRHIGRAAARKSLSIMIVDEAMAAEQPQPGLPSDLSANDPLVRRALLWMQQFPETPPTVAQIARQLGVSRLKLERHFTDDLGLTPSEAGRRMRISQVRALLERGDKSVTQIALETGFTDASHLIRTFRAAEGVTPDAWRRALRG